MMCTARQTVDRSFPAVPASIRKARGVVYELARDAGASRAKLDAVRLAVSEALTNAVLHAYPDEPGAIHVTAAVAGTELWVLISDDGCGLEARARRPGLGVGLALIAQDCDDFTIGPRSSRGVEVRMRFDLAPAPLDHSRGSVSSATSPASPRFSTTR
jgi:serine/threonine-protein kinase RsbW/stage II sporulation protein AB (anti-sigma F factor)